MLAMYRAILPARKQSLQQTADILQKAVKSAN